MTSLEEFRSVLDYNPATGEFIWKVNASTRARKGEKAGTVHPNGYRIIRYNGAGYRAHRLAWLFMYEKWPTNLLDHINGVKLDNRIENLRDVTSLLNSHNRVKLNRNNTTGYPGVTKRGGKFEVNYIFKHKHYYLGIFPTIEEAKSARQACKYFHMSSVGDLN